jgi:hypothetical protein
MHGKISAHRILVGKPEGKRSLGGHRPRWTTIKMYEGVYWIQLADDVTDVRFL